MTTASAETSFDFGGRYESTPFEGAWVVRWSRDGDYVRHLPICLDDPCEQDESEDPVPVLDPDNPWKCRDEWRFWVAHRVAKLQYAFRGDVVVQSNCCIITWKSERAAMAVAMLINQVLHDVAKTPSLADEIRADLLRNLRNHQEGHVHE